MKRTLFLLLIFANSLMLSAQDKIVFNDSTIIDCRIISIKKNLIKFENSNIQKTEIVLADTIKGYVYQGKKYYNSGKRKKVLFGSYQDPNTENAFIRISVLIPGFSFENRINQSISINAELGTGFGWGKASAYGYSESYIFYNSPTVQEPSDNFFLDENFKTLYPFFKFEIRHYYSLLRRQNHNKDTKNNSANYFSLYSLIYMDDLYFIGPTWGLQRNKNRFYFNMNLGGGMYFSSEDKRFQPLIDFKVGVLLNKKS